MQKPVLRAFLLLCLAIYLVPAGLCATGTDSLEKALHNGSLNDRQRLDIYISIAASLTTKDFGDCIENGNEGLVLAKKLRDTASITRLHNIVGEANYFKGNYDIAAGHFYKAVNISEASGDKGELALSFNNLAKLYRKTRELDKSLRYYGRAMDEYTTLNDSAGIQMIWNESGVVYEYQGNYDEAIRRYGRSMEYAKARKDTLGESYCLSFIGGVYMLQEKYAESERYTLACLEIRKKLKDTFSLAMTYSDLGNLYITMTDHGKAEQALEQSNQLASKLNFTELLATNYKMLSDLFSKKGEPALALSYFKMATTLHDSLFNIARSKQIDELNTKYETGKKEQQIALQQVAISRRNYIIAGIVLVAVLIFLLGLSVYRRKKLVQEARLQEEILRQQELAGKAILEAEENERQRIGQDLHDGVGQMMSAAKINLSTFLKEIEVPNEEERLRVDNILSLIDESCKEVRAVSHGMMPNALLKAGLASAVREFLNRIDSKVLEVNLYTEGLDKRLDTAVETVLYRVIQECVNNVIKHAQASRLDISIIKDEDGISATIEDNGKGFDVTDMSLRDGIGLKNIESRVHFLKGDVSFDSAPGHGTVVMISVPPS